MNTTFEIVVSPGAKQSLKALGAIQDLDKPIPKTGTNKFGKYNYETLADILGVLRPIVREHDCLLIVSTAWAEQREVEMNTEDGETKLICVADCIMQARIQSDTNPQDFIHTYSQGYGIDKSGDKALKANTVGARYVLLRLAALEGGDDPDGNESDFRADNKFQRGSRSRGKSTLTARKKTSKLI